MNFADYTAKAESWALKENFNILHTNESERKIIFKHKVNENVSFYVTCPNTPSSNEWNVWSDSDAVLLHLNEVLDVLGSCKEKSMEEVLQLTSRKLQPLFGAAKAEDSDASSGVGDCSDDEDDDDDDQIDDLYYQDDDDDALQDTASTVPMEEDKEDEKFFQGGGSPIAISRLVKDMKALNKSDGQFGVKGCPKGDNLFVWDVQLTDVDKKSLLGKDLIAYAKKYNREPVIQMELRFPKDYPMSPPFARVIRPRFQFLTGHVTIGGSICMEMLTKSGWRPINDIESILVQIRSEVMSDPNARLDKSNPDREYDEVEARQAFERTVQRYGWNN